MSDSSPRTPLVVLSWLTLALAMLAMSAPYMELAVRGQEERKAANELGVQLSVMASAATSVPPWLVAALLIVVLVALLAKEMLVADVVFRLGTNLAVAVTMLLAGYWLTYIFSSGHRRVVNDLGPLMF